MKSKFFKTILCTLIEQMVDLYHSSINEESYKFELNVFKRLVRKIQF